MKIRSVLPMRIAKYGSIALSVLFMTAGVMMIIQPEISAGILEIVFSVALILLGAIKLIGFFSKDLYRLAFQYDLQFGCIFIVIGLVTLFRPGDTVVILCALLGICLMIDSLFRIRTSLDARAFGIRNWWLTLILAAVTGLAALMLVIRPAEGARLLVRLLGIAFFTEGALNLASAVSMVKIVKHQKADTIDAKYYEIK